MKNDKYFDKVTIRFIGKGDMNYMSLWQMELELMKYHETWILDL